MFDIRYHIASLMAIFLALGLGILLGTVIIDKGSLARQQTQLVNRLESTFQTYKEDNRRLSRDLKASNKFEQMVLPAVIDTMLKKRAVTLVISPGSDVSVAQRTVKTLASGGADVCTVTLSAADFKTSDPDVKGKLEKYFSKTKNAKSDLIQNVVARLATEVGGPSDRSLLKLLTQVGAVQLEGEGNLPAEAVVFVASPEDSGEQSSLVTPLTQSWNAAGLDLVAVEGSNAKDSQMAWYLGQGLNTVDNADTVPGQVALVYVLRGAEGNWGVGPEAEGLMPPVPSIR